MSADSFPWARPAPSSGPGVWDSFYQGKAPQTREGLSLPSLPRTKYLCSLGIMCQGFEIPQKMEARTGPRLSCPFRPPGGLLGQLTGSWASAPACTLCSISTSWGLVSPAVVLGTVFWSFLAPDPTKRKAVTSEREEGT